MGAWSLITRSPLTMSLAQPWAEVCQPGSRFPITLPPPISLSFKSSILNRFYRHSFLHLPSNIQNKKEVQISTTDRSSSPHNFKNETRKRKSPQRCPKIPSSTIPQTGVSVTMPSCAMNRPDQHHQQQSRALRSIHPRSVHSEDSSGASAEHKQSS